MLAAAQRFGRDRVQGVLELKLDKDDQAGGASHRGDALAVAAMTPGAAAALI